MNRRIVIKNLAFIIGGAALLPSCLKSNDGASIHLNHLHFDGGQEKLMSDICETIIPKTNTPGAKDLKLHLFVLMMVDDCYKRKDQQAFMIGLNDFKDIVEKKYRQSFSDLDNKQREAVLNGIEKNGNIHIHGGKRQKTHNISPINVFYGGVKQHTIIGYTTSQYFMTKQIVYELIPGRYNAHFPAKKLIAV